MKIIHIHEFHLFKFLQLPNIKFLKLPNIKFLKLQNINFLLIGKKKLIF